MAVSSIKNLKGIKNGFEGNYKDLYDCVQYVRLINDCNPREGLKCSTGFRPN